MKKRLFQLKLFFFDLNWNRFIISQVDGVQYKHRKQFLDERHLQVAV